MGSTERLIPHTISSFLFAMHRMQHFASGSVVPLSLSPLCLVLQLASPNIIAKLLAIDFHRSSEEAASPHRPDGDDGTGRFYNLLFAQRDRHNITWHDRAKMGPQKFGIGRQQYNGCRCAEADLVKDWRKKWALSCLHSPPGAKGCQEGRIYTTYRTTELG